MVIPTLVALSLSMVVATLYCSQVVSLVALATDLVLDSSHRHPFLRPFLNPLTDEIESIEMVVNGGSALLASFCKLRTFSPP